MENIIKPLRLIIIDFMDRHKDKVQFSFFNNKDTVWLDLGFKNYEDFKQQLMSSNYILAWTITELMRSFMDENYAKEFLIFEETDDFIVYKIYDVENQTDRYFKIEDYVIIELEKVKKIIEIFDWKTV
jgi:hypothetical protein